MQQYLRERGEGANCGVHLQRAGSGCFVLRRFAHAQETGCLQVILESVSSKDNLFLAVWQNAPHGKHLIGLLAQVNKLSFDVF